jgi:hypothetical protein
MPLARWSVKRNKEHQLQQNLRIIRNAIDRYHDAAQSGLIEVPEGASGYPPSLDVLVEGVPLIGQMPPVPPGVVDEYAATGPGLTGGLRAQLEAGEAGGIEGMNGGFGGEGGGIDVGIDTGQGTSGFGTAQRPGVGRRATGGSRLSLGGQRAATGNPAGGSQSGSLMGSRRSLFDNEQAGGFAQGAGGFGGAGQEQAAEPLIGPDGQPVKLMFLRRLPVDPMTGKAEWGLRCYGEPPTDRLWCGRDVFDVFSKALGDAIDGTKYRDW